MELTEIPDVPFRKMCKSLNNRDLSKLIQASSYARQVCDDILKKRLNVRKTQDTIYLRYLIDKHIQDNGLYQVIIGAYDINFWIIFDSKDEIGILIYANDLARNDRFKSNTIDLLGKVNDIVTFLENLHFNGTWTFYTVTAHVTPEIIEINLSDDSFE